MKNQRFILTALGGIALTAPTWASTQEPVEAPVAQEPVQEVRAQDTVRAPGLYLPHTELMGQEISAKEGDESLTVGTVANLIVDGSTGKISHVVVAPAEDAGAEMRAVAYDALQFSQDKEGAVAGHLKMAPRAFMAIPAFDPEKIELLVGAKAVDAAAKRLDEATKDLDEKKKAEMVEGAREAMAAPSRSHLASALAGVDVYGPDEAEAFTTVGGLVIDCTKGQVAFATLAAGDQTYLVPFQALKMRPVRGETPEDTTWAVTAPTNAAGMVGAPTVNADEEMTASNPRFRAAVWKHYGIEAPNARGKRRGEKGEGAEGRVDRVKDGGVRKAKRIK